MEVPCRRLRTSRIRTVAIGVLLALVIPGSLALVTAQSAVASVSDPSWWKDANGNVTTCDTAHYADSYVLGASYNGVQACGPGPTQGGTDHLVRFYSGAWGEYEWECVELVMRYMYLVYGIAPYNAPGGKDVVDNYPGSVLSKVDNNGADLPTPGDILSFAASANHPTYGHTAIVTDVSVNTSGTGTVTYMQQNAGYDAPNVVDDGYGSVSVTSKVLGDNITGWLHDPNGATPSSQNPVAIRIGSGLYAKGALADNWSDEGSASNGYWKVAGSRIAKWDGNSGLWVKDGPNGVWYNVAGTDTSEWSISNNLVAIRIGSTLYAKSALTDSWSNEGSATNGYWMISGNRIAKWDGYWGLFVKDGPAGTWYNVTNSAVTWSVTNNLVIMQLGNSLYAKANLTDSWTLVDTSVTAGYWKVVGTRFAKWDGNSGLWVKDGMGDSWHNVAGTNTSEWAITANLIAIRIGSTLYAKSGTGGSWTDEGSATNGYWKLAGNRIAKWDGNSGLWVKDGPTGSFVNVAGTNTSEWAIGEG